MIQFANPLWLWGLLGLAIPITIHLLSKKEGKVIYVGSVRYLEESSTARFRSVRLNEVLLLLLRCLFLTLLILLLAGTSVYFFSTNKTRWILFEKGIENTDDYNRWVEKVDGLGFEVRFLSPGFPSISDSGKVKAIESYWALAEDLQQSGIDSVIVVSYNFEKFLRGERIAMPTFAWTSASPKSIEHIIRRVKFGSDSALITRASFRPESTSFSKEVKSIRDEDNLKTLESIKVAIVSDKEHAYDAKIVKASLLALSSIYKNIKVSEHNPDTYQGQSDWIFWLADAIMMSPNPQAKIIGIGNCTWKDFPLIASANELKYGCTETSGYNYLITSRLSEEVALEKHLTESLVRIIFQNSNSLIDHDRRVVDQVAMWSPNKNFEKKKTNSTQSISHLLTISLLATFLLERWLSLRRNQ
jgi:hypothetical protein